VTVTVTKTKIIQNQPLVLTANPRVKYTYPIQICKESTIITGHRKTIISASCLGDPEFPQDMQKFPMFLLNCFAYSRFSVRVTNRICRHDSIFLY